MPKPCPHCGCQLEVGSRDGDGDVVTWAHPMHTNPNALPNRYCINAGRNIGRDIIDRWDMRAEPKPAATMPKPTMPRGMPRA